METDDYTTNGSFQCPDTGHPVRWEVGEGRIEFVACDLPSDQQDDDSRFWLTVTEGWCKTANMLTEDLTVDSYEQLKKAAAVAGMDPHDL